MKFLKGVLLNGTATPIDATIVVNPASGKDIITEIGGLNTLITQSVNLLKDGTTDGSGGLPADYSTMKKLADGISTVKTTLNTFLKGEADGGDIDRLVELVAAIGQNKDSITALTSDKVAKADIVNALTSEDAGKVLSAAQGKALKTLIDNLDSKLEQQIAAIHSHDNKAVLDGISKNAGGNLVFNGHALDGATGIAVVASADATPVYDSQLVFVVEEITVGAA